MAEDGGTPTTDGEDTQRWFERYSWVVFVVIAATGLLPAIQLLVNPLSGTEFFGGFGRPVPELILSDPVGTRFLAFVMRWIGTVLIGGNLLTVFVAVTAWREGEPWAWLAMWYWPLLFTSHYLIYGESLLKTLQLVWVALTVLVLTSNYKQFFAPRSADGS